MKECIKCKQEKPYTEFNKDKSRHDGYQYSCRECSKKTNKKYSHKKYGLGKYNDYFKERYDNRTQEQIEDHREYIKEWGKKPENKAKRSEYQKKRYKELPELRIMNSCRKRIYDYLKGNRTESIKESYCKKLLGCSVNDYKIYLENQFTEDMDWSNYGSVWEIDHIVPLCTFDMNNEVDRCKAFNYTNTQPLSISENRRKGRKNYLDK